MKTIALTALFSLFMISCSQSADYTPQKHEFYATSSKYVSANVMEYTTLKFGTSNKVELFKYSVDTSSGSRVRTEISSTCSTYEEAKSSLTVGSTTFSIEDIEGIGSLFTADENVDSSFGAATGTETDFIIHATYGFDLYYEADSVAASVTRCLLN